MALSSPGVGSGLDVERIITQLVALERKPIEQLKAQKSSLQTKLSQWGQIKSALSELQSAAQRLREPALWNTRSATSSGSAVGASATGAASGSFAVTVSQLASAQNIRTAASIGSGALGWEGRLEFTQGTWSGGSFIPGSGTPVSVNVLSTDTLADIAGKINAAGAGVTATVVNVGGGQQRLALRSNTTGEVNGFAVRAFDPSNVEITDGTGLGNLSFATGITSGMAGNLAADAQLTIDGIPITSPSNTVTGAITGVTLTLSATTSSPVTVTVGPDSASYKKALENFQKAYNDLNTLLRNTTQADPTGGRNSGPLVGDQAALGVQRALRNVVGASGPSGLPFERLSDIGLQVQRDGSLQINTARLDAVLSNPDALRTFMDDASSGIATRVRDLASRLLAFDGSVSTRSQGLQNAIQRQDEQVARLESRVTRTEAQLRAQYTRLDSTLAGLNGLSSYLSQQVAQWNRSS